MAKSLKEHLGEMLEEELKEEVAYGSTEWKYLSWKYESNLAVLRGNYRAKIKGLRKL